MPTTSTGATNVPANYKTPRSVFSIQFGASPNGSAQGTKPLLIFAAKTSAGTAVANTVYPLPNGVDDARTLGGQGSETHLAVAGALTLEPTANVFIVCVPDAASSPVSATATLTVNSAPPAGNYVLRIHGVNVPFSVATGDVANTIAANITAAIAQYADLLCVTAVASSAVITITYRHAGTRGNSVQLRLFGATVNLPAASFTLSGTHLSAGAGADDVTAALAASNSIRYDFQVFPFTDSTNQTLIQTQLDSQMGPLVGKRAQGIFISVDTQGATTTLAQAMNDVLIQYLWYVRGETLPIVAAAAWGARRSVKVSAQANANLTLMSPTFVDLYPVVLTPTALTSQATDAEIESALQTGMTPIATSPTGHAWVVRSITSHSEDANGHPDSRTLDTNMVDVPIYFADDLAVQVPSQYPNMVLEDDPALDADPLTQGVVTPSELKGFVYSRAELMQKPLNYITNLENDLASWEVNLGTSPGRANGTFGITPAPWFVGVSANIRQQSLQS